MNNSALQDEKQILEIGEVFFIILIRFHSSLLCEWILDKYLAGNEQTPHGEEEKLGRPFGPAHFYGRNLVSHLDLLHANMRETHNLHD